MTKKKNSETKQKNTFLFIRRPKKHKNSIEKKETDIQGKKDGTHSQPQQKKPNVANKLQNATSNKNDLIYFSVLFGLFIFYI